MAGEGHINSLGDNMSKSDSASVRKVRSRAGRDELPADPVVRKLFADLQLATWGSRHAGRDKAMANDAKLLQREAWSYLIQYLTTLERPDLHSFDFLD